MPPKVNLYTGDCLEILKTISDSSVDSIVTDPPAGINFMGKDWDGDLGGRDEWIAWMQSVAVQCIRVLKPGAHALVWALPRTSHWTATAWENAGFEVRDRVSHIFGSGFPKSHDISKMIDKAAGAERKVIGNPAGRGGKPRQDFTGGRLHASADTDPNGYNGKVTEPATGEAKQWEGWGTALKPAVEDWWLFRKPIAESTIAGNVLKYGTGALNIEACRVPTNGEEIPINKLEEWSGFGQMQAPEYEQEINTAGRWPAHLLHDGSDEVVALFPDAPGQQATTRSDSAPMRNHVYSPRNHPDVPVHPRNDEGSAARFFYAAKPSQAEREAGLDGLKPQDPASVTDFRPTLKSNPENWANTDLPYHRTTPKKNNHPTVKPQALMQYLITLITPPGGIVLDPFVGSGSTGVAAIALERPFIGIEQDAGYVEIARLRIKHAGLQPRLF